MSSNKLIVIAGGIGSGKSVVSRICRMLGYDVYDCDINAKRLMNESEDFLKALTRQFGEDLLTKDLRINKLLLADLIFNDAEARLWVNRMVHEMVRRDVQNYIATAQKLPVMVESAIAASSGLLDMADSCWLVTADESVRIRRVMQRNGLDEVSIKNRIEAQRDEENLILRSGVDTNVILNNGDTPLLPQIMELLNYSDK